MAITITFNSSGTHVKKDLVVLNNYLLIRLDIGDKLSAFVRVPETVTKQDIIDHLNQHMKPELLTSVCGYLDAGNGGHQVGLALRNACKVCQSQVITANHEDLVATVNGKLAGFTVEAVGGQPYTLPAESIDVGDYMAYGAGVSAHDIDILFVAKSNPVTEDGIIDTIQFYVQGNITALKAASFPTYASTYDWELLGDFTSGAMRTASGLDITFLTGHYIGRMGTAGYNIKKTSGGAGEWQVSGGSIPGSGMSLFADRPGWWESFYGTGYVPASGVAGSTADKLLQVGVI